MVIFYIVSIIGASTIAFLFFHVNHLVYGVAVWYMRLFGIFFGIGVYALKLNSRRCFGGSSPGVVIALGNMIAIWPQDPARWRS